MSGSIPPIFSGLQLDVIQSIAEACVFGHRTLSKRPALPFNVYLNTTTVDGRNLKSNEAVSIPIPVTRDGVEQLLDALEQDKQTVKEASIEELEAEIDEAVYDLFDLTNDERKVIEEYLEVF
jgi:malate/lactate dehydrogenase